MASQAAITDRADANPGYRIHTLALGPMDNLVYVIENCARGHAVVIDPAWETEEIIRLLEQRRLKPTDILITHGHDDHVNGLGPLLSRFALSVHVSKEEAGFWRAMTSTAAEVTTPPDRQSEVWAARPPDHVLMHAGDESIEVGGIRVEILSTPGHSPGGSCYRVGDDLFTGDTLFVYGCGRCDLPGSDARRMFHSLQMLKERIPDEVTIYPGHHYAPALSTTMAEQCRANPFLHRDDEEAFVAFRAEHNRHRLPPYGPVPRGSRIW